MKKTIITLFLLLCITVILVASGQGEKGESIDIHDSTGEIVSISDLPERITFSGKASNIVADALYMFPEAHNVIVGVGNTNQRNGHFIEILDPEFGQKTYLDHSAGPEQIAVTNPDMVILKNYHKAKLGSSVSQLGIPVIYLDLESPEAYARDLTILGQVFGNPSRAAELVNYYSSEMEAVVSKTESLKDKPEILFLYHSTRDGVSAFNIPPESWIQTKMIKMAGGNPVWIDANPGNGWSKINMEQIAAWNPDQIFVVAYKEDISKVLQSIDQSEEWRQLNAFQNDKINAFPVDYYSWDQPGSRWILGLKWVAKQMHPEIFTDIDIEKTTWEFYRDLYFLTEEEYAAEIKSRLKW